MSGKMNDLTYDWFLGDVSESLGIAQVSEAAGKVEINTVFLRINLLAVWGPPHSLIKFNNQNNLGNVWLLFFLEKKKIEVLIIY